MSVATEIQPTDKLPKAGKHSPAGNILSQAQSGRAVIQELVPLAESLEWQLGQEYLRERGNKAFIADASPVPFVVNNDGTLSRNAAAVFFASLIEADKAGTLEEDIYVLELGIGVGLFARFFLDNFRKLCLEHDKDYYDRLCYIAADKSRRMLLDVCRHGVLSDHPGCCRLRIVDALEPMRGEWEGAQGAGPRPFRAVFLNYLLDCLPAAVLEIDGDDVRQLCVRTLVARNIKLDDYTDMTLEQLQERARSHDPLARQELLEVYGLFASEYDYRAIQGSGVGGQESGDRRQETGDKRQEIGESGRVPYLDFALDYGRRVTKRLLHSYGAIQSLEGLLGLLHDQGFILINDYGQAQVSPEDDVEHQRFSLATFMGLNFPLLKAYFETKHRGSGATGEETAREGGLPLSSSPVSCLPVSSSPLSWLEPSGDDGSLHSRLLGRELSPAVRACFHERFSREAQERLQQAVVKARECARVGRFELAAGLYQQAAIEQPDNWLLFNEIAVFLTFSFGDGKAGVKMSQEALRLNPTCSSDLWSTLGDALFEFGRIAEAKQAYLRALQINPSDVRARYNLSWVHLREKNFQAALQAVADALALDKTGEYRDRLLQKQGEILGQLALRNKQEYLLLVNLVSRNAKKDKETREKET